MGSGHITVGALLRGQVRRYLEEAQWHGFVTEWKEVKYFLESKFLFKGTNTGLAQVMSDFNKWKQLVN